MSQGLCVLQGARSLEGIENRYFREFMDSTCI